MSLVVRIALLRPLARLGPHLWGPRLAEVLVTRSHRVNTLPGSPVRRTAAAEEALTLCRRLAAERPGRHRVALARALTARADAPDTTPAAIDQLREAVGYVEDTDDRSALAVLATARGLLAANLHRRGEVQEARALALRAQATWERCGRLSPPERMRLAQALLVVGNCQELLDRPEEANVARRQAWKLHRDLSLYGRSKWLPVGTMAAMDLAHGLTVTGPAQEALDVIEEARIDAELWSRFRPRDGRPMLARVMLIEAECRAQLGDPETAVRLAEQAVGQQRATVEAGTPDARAALAHGLLVLGRLTAGAGRRDEATAHLTEAAELARDDHDGMLAGALSELIDLRIAAGDRTAADGLLAETVPLFREHTARLPEVWRPRLAHALLLRCELAVLELPAGTATGGDGLAAGREAVELARSLAGGDPAHRDLLGRCLFTLARAVHLTGDPRGSAELLRECVAVRWELFATDPVTHRLGLAEALCNLGNRTHALDRLDDAVGIYRECLDLLRADPDRIDRAELLTPLRNLGRTLRSLDRTAEAERIRDEIRAVEESVDAARPDPA
ncbi:tetratricopeptide repeat protein [Micromonospora sp. WMMC241]|uniref:tetratricopeptide repeat protein n=1 Tax=Micromonospora sp. WMMC241 TaxID=3015159 RepID=UPI0022B644E5|nr:tetratricopeptide repeat protein [Micromonospora sp. WMMC241]MCZ7439307.1 tetratricopeptide repeat protein [Micromonospora sp. WMMC241]